MRDKFKVVLTLSGPLFGEAFWAVTIGSVIVLFVSNLGSNNLAALGLANTAINAVLITIAAFGTAIASLTARTHGALDKSSTALIAGQTLIYSTVFGLALVLPFYFLATYVFSSVSDFSEATVDLAYKLLRVYILFLPLYFFIFNLRGFLQGLGNMRALMMQGLVTSALGLVAVSLFINSAGMKVFGVPLGQGSMLIFGVLVLLIYSCRRIGTKAVLTNTRSANIPLLKKIALLAWPIVVEQALMQGCILTLTVLLAKVGEIQFAGYQIALTLIQYPYMIFNCLGGISITIAGNFFGNGQYRKAFSYVHFVKNCGVVAIFVVGAVFAYFSHALVQIMSNEPDVLVWAEICLGMALLEMPFALIWNVYGFALRGMGDTKWPMYSTIVGVAGIRLPLVYLFVVLLHYNVAVVWLIYAGDSVVRAAIMWTRFRWLEKRNNLMEETC
ncbi:MAG: MATE family efflux transporter [Bacillota bacterium]